MKKLIILAVFTFLATATPKYVFGHVLETNGPIGAVLHIDPEDDPVAGKQAGFFFDFKDKEGKFKIEECDCIFSISTSGKEIHTEQMTGANLFYTFSEKSIYTIKVVGKPIANGSFKPFTLKYAIRVSREEVNLESSPQSSGLRGGVQTHTFHLIGGLAVVAFFVFALIKQNRQKKGGE